MGKRQGKRQPLKRVKGKKESPNVSSRLALNNAITMFKQGATKVAACLQWGLNRCTFDHYIKTYSIEAGDKNTILYEELPKGRPTIIKNIVAIMKHEVAISKKSVKQHLTGRAFKKSALKLLAAAQTNALQTLPIISKSSWERAYSSSCGSKKLKVSSSYSDRAYSLCDWRNAFSCCVCWFVFLKIGKVHACNVWSGDDVAVILNPMNQRLQVVRVTKEEHADLRARHLTVGAAKDKDRPSEATNFVAKLFNVVNAEGTRGPIIAKLLDNDFKWTDSSRWMKIYPVNKSEHLFVACVNKSHPKHCEIEYYEHIFTLVLVPYFVRHRKAKFVAGQFSQNSLSSPMASAQIELEDQDGQRIIFTMDGAYPGTCLCLRACFC